VFVPETVLEEPRVISSYDDVHERVAREVRDQIDAMTGRSVDLDVDFPLKEGENAAVTLTNEIGAVLPL